jgi:1-acyl-sn-glycerol-3-phosphate acyltransferase
MDQQSTAEPTAQCWLKTWAERLNFWRFHWERLVPAQTAQSPGQLDFAAPIRRERSLCNGISPWLAPLATVVTQDIALPLYFKQVRVLGQERLPKHGPLLLAPTHRSRWDALLIPYAAGRRVSGRDCRFMVTLDEMKGIQGWFLHRLGCFPVNQARPTTATLRYAVNLLETSHQLVVFPEGRIRTDDSPMQLRQGLARLALLAASQGVNVPVVPVGIAYAHGRPRFGDSVAICLGEPLVISGQGRAAAVAFNKLLEAAMQLAERQARIAIGVDG